MTNTKWTIAPEWLQALREELDGRQICTWDADVRLPPAAWDTVLDEFVAEACDATQTLLGAAFRPELFAAVRGWEYRHTIAPSDLFTSECPREDGVLDALSWLTDSDAMGAAEIAKWIECVSDWLEKHVPAPHGQDHAQRIFGVLAWDLRLTIEDKLRRLASAPAVRVESAAVAEAAQ